MVKKTNGKANGEMPGAPNSEQSVTINVSVDPDQLLKAYDKRKNEDFRKGEGGYIELSSSDTIEKGFIRIDSQDIDPSKKVIWSLNIQKAPELFSRYSLDGILFSNKSDALEVFQNISEPDGSDKIIGTLNEDISRKIILTYSVKLTIENPNGTKYLIVVPSVVDPHPPKKGKVRNLLFINSGGGNS